MKGGSLASKLVMSKCRGGAYKAGHMKMFNKGGAYGSSGSLKYSSLNGGKKKSNKRKRKSTKRKRSSKRKRKSSKRRRKSGKTRRKSSKTRRRSLKNKKVMSGGNKYVREIEIILVKNKDFPPDQQEIIENFFKDNNNYTYDKNTNCVYNYEQKEKNCTILVIKNKNKNKNFYLQIKYDLYTNKIINIYINENIQLKGSEVKSFTLIFNAKPICKENKIKDEITGFIETWFTKS